MQGYSHYSTRNTNQFPQIVICGVDSRVLLKGAFEIIFMSHIHTTYQSYTDVLLVRISSISPEVLKYKKYKRKSICNSLHHKI